MSEPLIQSQSGIASQPVNTGNPNPAGDRSDSTQRASSIKEVSLFGSAESNVHTLQAQLFVLNLVNQFVTKYVEQIKQRQAEDTANIERYQEQAQKATEIKTDAMQMVQRLEGQLKNKNKLQETKQQQQVMAKFSQSALSGEAPLPEVTQAVIDKLPAFLGALKNPDKTLKQTTDKFTALMQTVQKSDGLTNQHSPEALATLFTAFRDDIRKVFSNDNKQSGLAESNAAADQFAIQSWLSTGLPKTESVRNALSTRPLTQLSKHNEAQDNSALLAYQRLAVGLAVAA